MGTGSLAALNRSGSITPLISTIDRLKQRLRRANRFLQLEDRVAALSDQVERIETSRVNINPRREWPCALSLTFNGSGENNNRQ